MRNVLSLALGVTVLVIILFTAVIPQIQSAKDVTYREAGSDVIAAGWDYDVAISLSHDNLVEGSEKVYNSTYTAEKDTDYNIDYTNGTITFLSTGNLDNSSDYNVDYRYYAPAYTGTSLTLVGLTITMLVIGAVVIIWRSFMR